jgi:tryptophan 2,3-dioxygenase
VLPGTGHYTLIEPGAPGARAVAGTLGEMSAAFGARRPDSGSRKTSRT